MLSKIIVSSYVMFLEIAIWFALIGSIVMGFSFGQSSDAIGPMGGAFVGRSSDSLWS